MSVASALSTESGAFQAGIKKIIQQCEAAKIKYSEEEPFVYELNIDFPAGPTTRKLTVSLDEDVEAFSKIRFEAFHLVEGYNAICDYKNGTIEACVRLGPGLGLAWICRTLFGKKIRPGTPINSISLEDTDAVCIISKGKQPITIRIGTRSKELDAFATVGAWRAAAPLSLLITATQFTKNSEALSVLEKTANAVFFDLDLTKGVLLFLDKERRTVRNQKGKDSQIRKDLIFPSNQYEARAISLYWYARSARGMPLLEFLAFYQVVEFFFPSFSEKEALHRLKNILKDPMFDVHNDSQLGKILRNIKPSQRGFGNEMSQLTATIRACVEAKDLRSFFNEDEQRKAFYETGYKTVTSEQIPLRDSKSDLINEVATRIYKIRCRIVHTKDLAEETDVEPLLPFSKEAEHLQFDIELMEYVAKRVLITSSVKFES